MQPGSGLSNAPVMTETREVATPPRIVLRVAPRLLGDVVSLALREHGLTVELALDDGPPSLRILAEQFDLAVVSDGLAGEVIADTVLVLDSEGTTLSILREEKHRRLCGGEFVTLIQTITDLLEGTRSNG